MPSCFSHCASGGFFHFNKIMKHRMFIIRFLISALVFSLIIPISLGQISITDCNDLNATRDDLSGNYELANDIDCNIAPYNTGTGFDPFGSLALSFTGTFNGKGFEIDGIFMAQTTLADVALFGTTINAEISNLALTNVDITATGSAARVAGISSLCNSCEISNVSVSGSISGISNVGAIIGESSGGLLTNVFSEGSITSSSTKAGGLVGYQFSGPIINGYSTSNINGLNTVGGLVGLQREGGNISNAFSTGDVTGSAPIGSIVGTQLGNITNIFWFNSTGNPNDCFNGGNVGCTPRDNTSFFKGDISAIAPFSSWEGSFNDDPWNECIAPNDFPVLDSAQCPLPPPPPPPPSAIESASQNMVIGLSVFASFFGIIALIIIGKTVGDLVQGKQVNLQTLVGSLVGLAAVAVVVLIVAAVINQFAIIQL